MISWVVGSLHLKIQDCREKSHLNLNKNNQLELSVCKSIDDCLTAMSRNLKNKDFYVYKLKNTNIKKKIPSVKEVPDSSITNEVWLLEPSEFELVGKIRVTGTKGDGLSYTYGDNTAELYRWKWSYVK